MTFQIGMVGSDGILLASDTLCTNIHASNAVALDGTRTSFDAPKIQIEKAKGIAYCWSGDELGRILVNQISDLVNGLRTDMRVFLSMCSQEAIHRAAVIRAANPAVPIGSCEVLLAIQTGSTSVSLWKTRIVQSQNQFIPPTIEPIITKAITGDAVNAAAFFAEKYFPRFRKLPVQDLIRLAAHVVLMAGKLNSAGVGGLQIVVCRGSGFTELTTEEISSLVEQSSRLDSEIAERIGMI